MDNFSIKIEFLLDNLFNTDLFKDKLRELFFNEVKSSEYLWDKYEMYDSIRQHSQIVAIISLYLSYNIKKSCKIYNIYNQYLKYNSLMKLNSYILRSALLHDIGKTIEIKKNDLDFKLNQKIDLNQKSDEKKSHAQIGYEILINEKKIIEAYSCKMHLIDTFIKNKLPLIPYLINISDKHVIHSNYANLKKRFDDLKVRYPEYSYLFGDDVVSLYENSVAQFYTEKLDYVMNLYNSLQTN